MKSENIADQLEHFRLRNLINDGLQTSTCTSLSLHTELGARISGLPSLTSSIRKNMITVEEEYLRIHYNPSIATYSMQELVTRNPGKTLYVDNCLSQKKAFTPHLNA